MEQPLKLLAIAGSDSGGAAGLQADLKTWTAVRAYGMSVITVVTAQNSLTVKAVQFLSPDFVSAQLEAVLSDYGADGVKTGFIGRADLITTIATKLKAYSVAHLVVDPVLVNHKGQAMFPPEIAQAYCEYLFPLAQLITPNGREAEALTGLPVRTLAEMETAAAHLHSLGPQNVLIKRGLVGNEVVDVLFDGTKFTHFHSPQIATQNTHGSGDMLSAAVCAFLARGDDIETAVRQARHLTHTALQQASNWQLGNGHGPLAIFDLTKSLDP
jgi:hydroxymethylpyrimidine/phosphomethylpyrimidine kinase